MFLVSQDFACCTLAIRFLKSYFTNKNAILTNQKRGIPLRDDVAASLECTHHLVCSSSLVSLSWDFTQVFQRKSISKSDLWAFFNQHTRALSLGALHQPSTTLLFFNCLQPSATGNFSPAISPSLFLENRSFAASSPLHYYLHSILLSHYYFLSI